jgi:hypothetical protein
MNSAAVSTSATFIVYGSGAQSGQAAIVQAITTSENLSNVDLAASNFQIEIIGVFSNVAADSFVVGNFS